MDGTDDGRSGHIATQVALGSDCQRLTRTVLRLMDNSSLPFRQDRHRWEKSIITLSRELVCHSEMGVLKNKNLKQIVIILYPIMILSWSDVEIGGWPL